MSFSKANRVIVIIILLCIVLDEILVKSNAAVTRSAAEQQEDYPVGKGIIVQPAWTNKEKFKPEVESKVVVTQKNIDETKALRDELEKSIRAKPSSESAASGKIQHLDTQNLGAIPTTGGPNVVEASAMLESEIDLRKLQKLEISKRRTREILTLNYVEEDYSFNLGEDILEWEHILHNEQEYFIGRRVQDLLVIHKNTASYEKGIVLNVSQPITYLETYSFFNLEQQQQEGIILVSSADRVLWYRGDKVTNRIQLYWQWVVGSEISGLTYFKALSKDHLAISSKGSLRRGYYALNIYEFDLLTKEFWVIQRIQLEFPCNEVTFLDTGSDLIMAVAQNDSVIIYLFNPHEAVSEHVRFKFLRKIESEGIQAMAICGFQMGGRSYLALGGLRPQILLHQQGDFIPRTILGNNFGLVEFFLPIPARTYRDDLILLVQHRVDFETHSLTVVETLIWDGEAFEASIPVPCKMANHTVFGMSCLLDIQRDEGLKGAALLRRGNEVSVIVPRKNAESGLFRLHFELQSKNSELLDLQEIFDFLQDWVKEQDDLIAAANRFLTLSDVEMHNLLLHKLHNTKVDLLETPELIFNGDFDRLFINDYLWTNEDSIITLDQVLSAVEQLGTHVSESPESNERHKRDVSAQLNFDSLTVDSLDVDFLTVDQLNGEKFYIQNGELIFDGVVNLENLEVLGTTSSNQLLRTRQFEEQFLKIDKNLEFENINGIPWANIEKNLIFKDDPLMLPKLDVKELVIEDTLTLDVLNGQNFPEDYLFSTESFFSTVLAEKNFTNTLITDRIDTDGLINGVNPMDAINLSEPQEWPGLVTFAKLEVMEKLMLNGFVVDEGSTNIDIPKNFILKESNTISANCNFKNLKVRGVIYLKGNFDNFTLQSLLADIVQRPADPTIEIVVPSKKTFSSVEFPPNFQLDDGAINGIPLERFIPKHTKQFLNITKLEGQISFNNLTLDGLYDGIDLNDLLAKAIWINESQSWPETQFNFENSVIADEVIVSHSLNDIPIDEGYQTLDEDLILDTASFHELNSKRATITSDIYGEDGAKLNGIDPQTFFNKRQWSDLANITDIHIDELILDGNLQTDSIHGIKSEILYELLDGIDDDLPGMIKNGKVQVENMIVTNDIQLHELNDRNFDEEVQQTAIWLNRRNYINTNLEFLESLNIRSDLNILGEWNGINMINMIDDLVFQTPNDETPIIILAPKRFVNKIFVRNNTNVVAINGIPLSEIATKVGPNHFHGNLEIKGRLFVNEIIANGSLNNLPNVNLENILQFDKNSETFILKGDIPIDSNVQLNDLTVLGSMCDLVNIGDFFNQLVYKNNITAVALTGQKTFSGRINIQRGAYIDELNGHDVNALLDNIVLMHERAPVVIKGPVEFLESVSAPEAFVKGKIYTSNISNCSVEDWLTNTIRIDRPQNFTVPLSFVSGSLDDNSFQAKSYNGIDLAQDILTLYTEQNFTNDLMFSELYLDGNITVDGLVNGYDIATEYANTLMTYGEQHVKTPLVMHSLLVQENLQINAPVNGNKNFENLATLHKNLEFESSLFFENVVTNDLYTNHIVSGIDFQQWMRDALWLDKRAQQYITGNWTTETLIVVESADEFNVTNDNDDMDLQMISNNFTQKLRQMKSVERNNFNEDEDGYRKLKSKFANEQIVRPIRYFRHLERKMTLQLDESYDELFALASGNKKNSYLFMKKDCQTVIYEWNPMKLKYQKLLSFTGGDIKDIRLSPNNKNRNGTKLCFITSTANSSERNCTNYGFNLWCLTNNNSIVLSNQYGSMIGPTSLGPSFESTFFALNGNKLSQFDVNQKNAIHNWHLPTWSAAQRESFRFLPVSKDLAAGKIILCSESYIAQLNINRTVFISEKKYVNDHHLTTDFNFNRIISNLGKSDLQITNNIHLKCGKEAEIVNVFAGPTTQSRNLLAITKTNNDNIFTSGLGGIDIYDDPIAGRLFQKIVANKPSSVISLHIEMESFLAYIDDCCTVNVLIYRGIQGFIEIAKFQMKSKIIKLLGITLPIKDVEIGIANDVDTIVYHLAIVLKDKIVFYEFVGM